MVFKLSCFRLFWVVQVAHVVKKVLFEVLVGLRCCSSFKFVAVDVLGCLGFFDVFFCFSVCHRLFRVVQSCFRLLQVVFGCSGPLRSIWCLRLYGAMLFHVFFVFTSARLQSKVLRRFLVVRVVVGFLGDLRCYTLFQVVKIVFTLFEELRVV